jgi:hypothetical protein
LRGSAIINDIPRAGFTPPITIVDGIDTIEVSNIDLTLLDHSFFGDARDVLTDMFQLIMHNADPAKRAGLEKASISNELVYWKIKS